MRNFGGAYSIYSLVYPLTSSDLDELRSGDADVQAKWASLGMEDIAAGRQYLRQVGQTRDQRILGLEALDAALLQR